jgi:hypothetical protein
MGSSQIPMLARFACAEQLTVISLFDSDPAGKKARADLGDQSTYKNISIEELKKGAVTIEDLTPRQLYLAAVGSFYSQFSWYKEFVNSEPEINVGIIDKLNKHFDKLEHPFDKTSVAREFLKQTKIKKEDSKAYISFSKLFEIVNKEKVQNNTIS